MSSHNLEFPRGIGTDVKSGQPYMLLTSYESKNAIESVGQKGFSKGSEGFNPGITKSSIALYIPPNALKTAWAATYEDTPGGAKAAGLGGAFGRMGETGVAEILTTALKSAGLFVAGKAAESIDKGTGMLAAQGLAVNNHMALTYKGPTATRNHEFAFNFFPKNVGDANAIKEILKDFENGMLPRMGGGGEGEVTMITGRALSQPFFKSPRHWTIDFFMKAGGMRGEQEGKYGNDFLFQIKKSVITAMSVNHDPNSTISLHEDGSPVQTTLTLTFKEIELPISDGG